jgi:glucan phosphoethanolaminetransferase (alkaline phosphatase superfamily)
MATTSKALFRGAASTSSTTLYTVPSATTTVITNVIVTNTAASTATFTLNLNGVAVASGVSLAANSITAIDLKQVLAATNTITGLASATTVNFHISGVEIA